MNNTSGHRKIILISVIIILMAAALTVQFADASGDKLSTSANSAPVAENLEYTTYRGIAISEQLTAFDPDGDKTSFYIMDNPSHGTVVLNADGHFTYTPDDGKHKSDSFSYIASDTLGNISETATVKIRILKKSTGIFYSDMDGNRSHRAAVFLAEKGLFTGENVSGVYFFEPDAAVSRGEFLTMCLALAGKEILPEISMTGFSDDADTPQWVKPYISTGLLSGVVRGCKNEYGEVVFCYDRPVTLAEAAVMLNNTLCLTEVPASSYIDETSLPAWACQAAANLISCSIISASDYSSALTRAEAAEILFSASEVLNVR